MLSTLQHAAEAVAGPSPSAAVTARQIRRKLLAAVLEVSQPALPRYTARHLAQLTWSLAKLGARPSTAWAQVSGTRHRHALVSVTASLCSTGICNTPQEHLLLM
jgi:hypothetical protein